MVKLQHYIQGLNSASNPYIPVLLKVYNLFSSVFFFRKILAFKKFGQIGLEIKVGFVKYSLSNSINYFNKK